LRIAYISLATPLRLDAWSGMPWYSFREISRRFNDVHLVDTPTIDSIVEPLSVLQRYGLSVRQRRFLSAIYSRLISPELERIKPDIVLSIGASHKLIRLDPKWRLIHVSDGLFTTMVNYYEKYGRYRQGVLRAGHEDMQRFINKTAITLFASTWARDSAIALWDLDPARARVVPFGANLDADPGYRPRRMDGPLRLLFVGYDWKRKGGPIAIEVWRELRKMVPDAELHIVGCEPPAARGLDGVTVHGRLNKGDPDEFAKLKHLYENATLFIMPSREEAFGMVYCEAAAYGVPSVASLTGGVPTVIVDGETGLLLPMDAPATAYAERILALWRDKERLAAFSRAARHRYETVLSWDAWGRAVEQAIDDTLALGPPGG
jgi:glycosyltransferase involved in cell wall biosynthesis